MKNTHSQRIIPTLLIAFGLCLVALPAARADDDHGRSIVGLWHVEYFSGGTELFQTYDQWHSDRLEFEVNGIAPGAVCQGVFKQENGIVKLFHVIWNFDANGVPNGHIEETQRNTVNREGNSYSGTFDNKIYDLNGKFLGEETGTVRATRLTVY